MYEWEEELERVRVQNEERLKNLETCVERIKDLLKTSKTTKEDLEEIVSEIEWEIKSLD